MGDKYDPPAGEVYHVPVQHQQAHAIDIRKYERKIAKSSSSVAIWKVALQ
jgi:hypothetical protein